MARPGLEPGPVLPQRRPDAEVRNLRSLPRDSGDGARVHPLNDRKSSEPAGRSGPPQDPASSPVTPLPSVCRSLVPILLGMVSASGSGIGDTARVTMGTNGRERLGSREWASEAVRRIEADENRSADTHLHAFPLPPQWGIDLYLKDESVHPTGSLKHRLARSLFLYGLCNGWITARTTVVEASSGSTAVSEAYFAHLLGLRFVAVMPATTSPEKIALIEAEGASCHLVGDPSAIVAEAQR